jgi:hypothetical protein
VIGASEFRTSAVCRCCGWILKHPKVQINDQIKDNYRISFCTKEGCPERNLHRQRDYDAAWKIGGLFIAQKSQKSPESAFDLGSFDKSVAYESIQQTPPPELIAASSKYRECFYRRY